MKLAFFDHLAFRFLFILIIISPFYFWRLYHLPQYQIPENQTVKIRGTVSKETYLKGSYQIIEVGSLLIMTNRFPGYFYGDQLIITGKFEKQLPGSFQSQYIALFPTIEKEEKDFNLIGKSNLKRWLLKTKGHIEERINRSLTEPEASLLLGIILGMKKQIPENFWHSLRETGTLHLVVVSGQNVSLLAGMLLELFVYFFKRRLAIILASLGIILYVVMVGGEPPVVRAGLMALGFYFGQFIGRESHLYSILFFTVILMLLLSPLILFDISFQLSLAATLGIVFIYPLFKEKKSLFILPFLSEGFWVTISAQLTTLPILLINFGQISWLSPLVNTLVLPTIPFIMVLGSLLVIASFISSLLSQLLSWFVWLFLGYFVNVVNFFGNLPYVSWQTEPFSGWWAWLYYLILILVLIKFYRKGKIARN